jgi:hypothetical protein
MVMPLSPDHIDPALAGSDPATGSPRDHAAATSASSAVTATPTDASRVQEQVERAAQRRVHGLFSRPDQAPVLSPFALHGVAGEVVEATAPHTEASPAAMLVTLLTAFGAMVGRGAHIAVGPEHHHARIFALVVGATGRARKGTSLKAISPALEAAGSDARDFLTQRRVRGLASGEGLIAAMSQIDGADALNMWKGAGDADHRALVIEEEFAGVLIAAQRQGSKLSAVIRQLWDGDDLHVTTKRDPLKLSHPHAGVLGHITAEELKETMTSSDVTSGFANRFLMIYSERTRLLAEPRPLPQAVTDAFGARLGAALRTARSAGEVTRSPSFRALWARWYGVLEDGPSGGRLFDSLSRRASPYVLRLALLYALLDGRSEVDAVHLRAALAVWQYSEASIARVWGMSFGEARLDKLWAALCQAGPGGLTRDAVNKLFSNNGSAEVYDGLANALVDRGFARLETRRTGQRGRPPQVLVRTM